MLVTICFTTFAVFLEIVMRYIVKHPFIGIEELAAYVAFWLYFIGGSYGSYERSHITADISSVIFKDPVKYAKFHALVCLVTTLITLYTVPLAWDYVKWGFEMAEQSSATLFGDTYRVVYFQGSTLVGLSLMCFYFFVDFCQWFKAGFIDHKVPDDLRGARKEIDSWIG